MFKRYRQTLWTCWRLLNISMWVVSLWACWPERLAQRTTAFRLRGLTAHSREIMRWHGGRARVLRDHVFLCFFIKCQHAYWNKYKICDSINVIAGHRIGYKCPRLRPHVCKRSTPRSEETHNQNHESRPQMLLAALVWLTREVVQKEQNSHKSKALCRAVNNQLWVQCNGNHWDEGVIRNRHETKKSINLGQRPKAREA